MKIYRVYDSCYDEPDTVYAYFSREQDAAICALWYNACVESVEVDDLAGHIRAGERPYLCRISRIGQGEVAPGTGIPCGYGGFDYKCRMMVSVWATDPIAALAAAMPIWNENALRRVWPEARTNGLTLQTIDALLDRMTQTSK